MTNSLTAIILAYLIGSLSFAVIVSKLFGLPDPHTYGSGNPGATNVLRTGKKLAALLTLLGDAAKGWFALWLAQRYAVDFGLPPLALAGVALAVFIGHLFPIFFRFQGGKGVATAAGILIAINCWLGLATLATWLIIAVFFRYSSLAALMSAIFAPFYTFFLFGLRVGKELAGGTPASTRGTRAPPITQREWKGIDWIALQSRWPEGLLPVQ